MESYLNVNEIQVAPALYKFIEREALPGSGVESGVFWRG